MHVRSRIGPWLSAAALLLVTQGVSQPVAAPNIDFDQLGQVAIAGNFDAVALYEYVGQKQGFSSSSSGNTDSVLSQLPSGLLSLLASSDASIQAMCPFVLRNGTYVGLLVGGNFTSLGGVDARSVAIINTETYTIRDNPGIEGSVTSMYCDQDTETVYVGGSFEASISRNAIAWVAGNTWANLNFQGFDGPVYSINKAPDGNIIFGGAFSGLGNSSAVTGDSTSNDDLQVINLGGALVTSEGNSTSGQAIICPPGSGPNASPWLLQDNTPGFWQANFQYGFEPKALRLWNANSNGRGVRTFRFTALPINGILNMTYINSDGVRAYCDATCPLPQGAQPQEFEFVNSVGMNSFRIDVSEWYGSGGGLSGIEILQQDIFSYAIDRKNPPACGSSQTLSTASTTGSWYETPSGESNADYLTVVTGPTTVGTTEITFEPDIQADGNYTIVVYTPGCRADSSCSARAIVNITGILTEDGATSFNSLIYQTNDYDKYDPVYTGRIQPRSGSFTPRVTLRPSGFQTDQLVVASKIRFALSGTTGGLNGLFEFNPSLAMIDPDFSKSAINSAGNVLRPNAQINALTTHGDTLYAAGRFQHDEFSNIMAFRDNRATSLPNGGLNGDVLSIHDAGDRLYIGGNFSAANENGPTGLSNAAAYDYASNAWIALGSGLDGAVETITPLVMNIGSSDETVITFSGRFQNIVGGSNVNRAVSGFAIWVPSRNAWLNTLDIPKQMYAGQLTAYTSLPNGTWIGAGTLTSLGDMVSGAVGVREASQGRARLQQLPLGIESSANSASPSSLTKREIIGGVNVTGVAVATWDTSNNRNLTIFGGQFSATNSDSANIQNLLFFDGSSSAVSGLPTGLDSNSTFLTLAVKDDILVAGGSVSGSINSTQITGLIMYDLAAKTFRSVQPAGLIGAEEVVYSIGVRPSSSNVYVGGSFDQTSQQLSCRSVCAYDLSTNQWSTVGGQLSGTVSALYWISGNELLAAGNLTVSGNMTMLARYNVQQQTWAVQNSAGIPGPVTTFAPGTRNADHIWVAGVANNGSTYLMEIDGNNFRPVAGAFETGSIIRGLKVVHLSQDHANSQYLNQDEALLVSGQLDLTGFGRASVALFDGSTFRPYAFSSTVGGDAGSASGFFSERSDGLRGSGSRHARGITVLVALCAALGTVFLIILIGIIANKIQQRRSGYSNLPTVPYSDKNANLNRVPPETLFGSLGQRNPAAPTV